MKKLTFAQMQAEQTKARLTEILTAQIEKLVNSSSFELDEIFDIFQKAVSQRSSYHSESEFLAECNKNFFRWYGLSGPKCRFGAGKRVRRLLQGKRD